MRRRGFLPALLLLVLLVSGCWSRIEVTDLGVVIGMGVDRGKSSRVRVTLYISRSPGSGPTERGEARWVVAREGVTIADALRHVSQASPRRITLHHLRIVLIGEEYARQGMGDLFDFVSRSPQVRLITRIMVVRGSAQEVLETPPQLEALQPENISEMVPARGGPEPRLKDVLVSRTAETSSPWVYAMHVITRPARVPGAGVRAAELNGAALLRKDRVVAMLDRQTAQGLAWFENSPKEAVITAPCPGDQERRTSARVTNGKVTITPRLTSSKLSFLVEAVGQLEMISTDCGAGIPDPAVRRRIELQLEAELKTRLKAAVQAFQAAKTDPVAFGKRVQLAFPAYWRTISQRWPELWAGTPVTITSRLRITEAGLLLEPADRTRAELQGEKP